SLTAMGLQVDKWVPDLTELAKHPAYIPAKGRDFSGRPNVVGIHRGDAAARSLLFNGHVDTIPWTPVSDWQFDPLCGELREGKILGRGSSDMKGGLAAMTMALKALLDIGLAPRGTVILEYVMDEEVSGLGTLACVTRGYKADAGISLETSDLHVQPACIGRLWFVVDVRGKPAGISRRWEAINALDKGYKIAKAIEDFEGLRINTLTHPLFPDNRGALPCAVGKFEAGHYASATPDRAILRGSMGLMPQEDIEQVKKDFQTFIRNVCDQDPWLSTHQPEVWFEGLIAEGAEIPLDHPIVMTVAQGFREVTGQAPAYSGRMGAADTRFLIRHGDTPTVIFGPGVTAQMHATNEWLPLDNLVIATKTLALTIHDWCG
ncbi:MAG TPA: ArgE/DapE family deacylase, partial [Vicinamibacterales bacterium]|nr:ArgE/DapE family deacylase [Vicinamibacterales bacterium]